MKKLTQKQLEAVNTLAGDIMKKEQYIRKGQAFFAALNFLHPGIADEIRATDTDPYYCDDQLEACIKKISTGE